jgi:heavy metal translocating P-type ATPase
MVEAVRIAGIQVVHAIPGRIRVKMARLRGHSEFAREIHERLAGVRGIQSVEANPLTGSVLVRYEAGMLTSLHSLLALSETLSRLFPDLDLRAIEAWLAPSRHGAAPHPSLAGGASTTMADRCRVVHAIRGRLRMRLDCPQLFDGLSEACESFLRDQPGIQEVRLNPSCRSVILTYDPARRTEDELVSLMQALSLDQLETYQPQQPLHAVPAAPSVAWQPLALSSAAVAIGVLAESALAPWLLVGAAVPIFTRAIEALFQQGKLNVDVMDAAATTVLALQGQVQTAAVMVWLVSLGHVIRDLTRQQSHRAIEALFDGRTQFAWVVRDGEKMQVRVEAVRAGDEVVVYPGELIPVDGTVVTGTATVDQQILTGESMLVEKSAGDQVYAATVVRDGKLYLTAAKVGAETMAAKVVQLVRDAPVRETRIQNYTEQFADRLVPWSFFGAGLTLVLTGDVNRVASLLIVDYGTGIRVAAPTTVLASMTKAARQGILMKGGRSLERLAAVDAIIFDKTGTLTLGVPEVVEVIPYGQEFSAAQILALAAAAQQRLAHPVAEAIVRTAKAQETSIPERETSEYTIGLGVEASVEGAVVLVGSRRFMEAKGIAVRRARADLKRLDAAAAAPIFVARDGRLIGLLALADPLRPEAGMVIQALRERGVADIIMLTGDHPAVARKVADVVGITRYIADALPGQKAELVRTLQAEGHTVAVVGDGINDSPALAQADVGIAVRGGVDVARETAHVALLEGNLWKIPQALDIARESIQLIQQNWHLILYPNTAAIALALLGLSGPIGATLISNGSAIVATVNALRPLLDGITITSRRG